MANRKPRKRSYDQLVKVGLEYYRDDNFCSVIATAGATGLSFGKIAAEFKREGRETGKGVKVVQMLNVLRTFGVEPSIAHEELEGKQFRTVAERLKNKGGVYAIIHSGHVTLIRKGEMVDHANWADTRGKVRGVWELTGAVV